MDRPTRQTRLNGFVDGYASRTSQMKASEIRALFAVASRPEVVSLAGGMPTWRGGHAVRLRTGRPNPP
jgi:hypothetical protein